MQEHSVYVSITGLRTNGLLAVILFWRYALASNFQAQKADGLVSLQVKRVGKYHHTLTVWKNKDSMLAYRNSGAHLAAMKLFSKIATGSVFGYESRAAPSWEEALGRWQKNARQT